MNKQYAKVIGVMSGTSCDGIDVAYIRFSFQDQWRYELIHAKTYPYTDRWSKTLQKIVLQHKEELKETDLAYTRYTASVVQQFIDQFNLQEIDAVCSHGHTVHHQPQKGYTYQIGNQPLIASQLGLPVVCDFRVSDVALGGQGAPLVPIGDQLLFSAYDVCVNLGGFTNLSYSAKNKRIAYDSCPFNIILNTYAQQLGKAYDEDGAFAKSGTCNPHILAQLNALPYYHISPPKSLGIEWVQQHALPLLDQLTPIDAIATATEHTAVQLARSLSPFNHVLLTGGGTYNRFFLDRLRQKINAKITIPSQDLIEFKEALIFALLGVLKLQGKNNCLASVTGASRDHSSGKIYLPEEANK